jgi:hypothetical protein
MTFDLSAAIGQTINVDYGAGVEQITLQNPYLIARKDLAWNGDSLGDDDYDDMIYLCDKVAPTSVPEPASLMLLLFGLFGLAGCRRKFGTR